MIRLNSIAPALLLAAGVGVSLAATPPPFINYQGVLRDNAGQPLNGSFQMRFRLHDALTAGNLIMSDMDQTVLATNGLFDVQIGAGTLVDGPGPGTYIALPDVFRDFTNVFLEVEIFNGTSWETLTPRKQLNSAPYALNASSLGGMQPSKFLDTSSTLQAKSGALSVGTANLTNPFNAMLQVHGAADNGIYARGTSSAGVFHNNSDPATSAELARAGGYGIFAQGSNAGGRFWYKSGLGSVPTSDVSIAESLFGVHASGPTGGAFSSSTANISFANIGTDSGEGVFAMGETAGGHFVSGTDINNEAFLGYGTVGIAAKGTGAAGHFDNVGPGNTSTVYLAIGDGGISSYGEAYGGVFVDTDASGLAYVALGDRGIWGKGTFAGGTFSHPDNVTFWADVATPTRKIVGTGVVSFVQNHPYEKDKVIVYAAPEGDEVAVYTRGSARLVNGEARVKLGETFRLVANPDIGLTAQVTGRGEDAVLTVSSVSTEELVVKAVSGFPQDAEFDYSVHGLRIGFEATPIVKVKERQAFLPDPQDLEAELGGQPALRTQTALARFEAMAAAGGRPAADFTSTRALASAIDEDKDVILAEARAHSKEDRATLAPPASELMPQVPPAEVDLQSVQPTPPIDPAGPRAPERRDSPVRPTSRQRDPVARIPVVMAPTSGHVETGDVLVLDTIEPGSVRAGDAAQDPRVAGCALAPEPGWPEAPGKAAVGTTGVVICRADAGLGAIQVGDLLTTSSTPGHAMLARDPVAGTILGKAIEPLAEGTGLIRVLITLR